MRDTLLSLGDFLDLLHDGAIVIDGRGDIVFANRAITGLFGHTPQQLVGGPLSVLIPPPHRQRHATHVGSFHAHGRSTPMGDRPLLHGLHRAGHEVAVSISLSNLDLPAERFTIAIVRDAAPAKHEIGLALSQAETDPLTGLGNRLHLSRRLHEAIAPDTPPFTLAYLDLVDFKQVNDRHGHATGDEMLRVVARRLRHQVREGDTAARIGGDEFVVVFNGLDKPAAIEDRLQALAAQFAEPVHLADTLVTVRADIGSALWPRDGATSDALLEHADRAMYEAKRARRSGMAGPFSRP